MNIQGVSSGIGSIGSIGNLGQSQKASGTSFKEAMINNLNETNNMLNRADVASEDFTMGRTTDIHKVIIAMEQSQLSMQYTVQVRNRLVEGFQTLMRMQV